MEHNDPKEEQAWWDRLNSLISRLGGSPGELMLDALERLVCEREREMASTRPIPTTDLVRVLRILEYTGPRAAVEDQVARSVSGEKTWGRPGREVTIRAATIGTYPKIIHPRQINAEQINADAIKLLNNPRVIVATQSERYGTADDRHASSILASIMLHLKGHRGCRETVNNWWVSRKWEVPGE